MSKIREYTGDGITVRYDVKRCIHAGECTRGLPAAFDVEKRPWIQPGNALADEVAGVVRRCPSGALQFERTDSGTAESTPTENVILITPNGPLYVSGDVSITTQDGEQVHQGTRVALCRCGASENKPFCDNAHKKIEFHAAGTVTDNRSATDIETGGSLKVMQRMNGPYLLQGNFEIRSVNGESVFQGTKAALCRCGGSTNKPFCDGTHRTIGFEAS